MTSNAPTIRTSRIAGSPGTMNCGITVTKNAPVLGFSRLLNKPWPQALVSPSVVRGRAGEPGSPGDLVNTVRSPREQRYAAPASLSIVTAVEERSTRTPTPHAAAVAHARIPTAMPNADRPQP